MPVCEYTVHIQVELLPPPSTRFTPQGLPTVILQIGRWRATAQGSHANAVKLSLQPDLTPGTQHHDNWRLSCCSWTCADVSTVVRQLR
jgi:hypothetical protein